MRRWAFGGSCAARGTVRRWTSTETIDKESRETTNQILFLNFAFTFRSSRFAYTALLSSATLSVINRNANYIMSTENRLQSFSGCCACCICVWKANGRLCIVSNMTMTRVGMRRTPETRDVSNNCNKYVSICCDTGRRFHQDVKCKMHRNSYLHHVFCGYTHMNAALHGVSLHQARACTHPSPI